MILLEAINLQEAIAREPIITDEQTITQASITAATTEWASLTTRPTTTLV